MATQETESPLEKQLKEEIKRLIDTKTFFYLSVLLAQYQVTDDGMIDRLNRYYHQYGQQVYLASQTPADRVRMKEISDAEVKELFGP